MSFNIDVKAGLSFTYANRGIIVARKAMHEHGVISTKRLDDKVDVENLTNDVFKVSFRDGSLDAFQILKPNKTFTFTLKTEDKLLFVKEFEYLKTKQVQIQIERVQSS